jgi:APA family basic amino acid/polyamine antiporter
MHHTVPGATLRVLDFVALTVGIVVGAGIFRTPSLVAAHAGSEMMVLGAWLLGGAVSLIGALCYAELVTTYPHAGGDYHFLTRAFGKRLAFLFAWARMLVMQTGSIARALGLRLWRLRVTALSLRHGFLGDLRGCGGYSPYRPQRSRSTPREANAESPYRGGSTRRAFGYRCRVCLRRAGAPLLPTAEAGSSSASPALSGSLGMVMIFVLLTYGGWNEAAYLSSEVKGDRRQMAWALIGSIGLVTGLYVLANWAYLRGLGLDGMAGSDAVAAELMHNVFGPHGAGLISALVALSALTSANATIITGARTNYALGRDFPLFAALGHWNSRAGVPTNALLIQCAIALALVLLGLKTRRGFETVVEYPAPVFWFFFLLVGISLFVLRWREPQVPRPFRVPLFPLIPLFFCAASVYVLYSSLAYTGAGALVGVSVVGAGALLLLCTRRVLPPP